MLRRRGITTDMGFKGNLKKRLQKADAQGATLAVFVDAERWAARMLEVKVLATGEQVVVTDNSDLQLDVDDEIFALSVSAKLGVSRSGIAVTPGGSLGFVGNGPAEARSSVPTASPLSRRGAMSCRR
jgi:histidyl-tRNA synthetase